MKVDRSISRWLAPALIAWSCIAAATASDAQTAESYLVTLDTGVVEGQAAERMPTVREYKGIPFAAPPTGDLRWRPPEPPASWEGVRPATKYAPRCIQSSRSDSAPTDLSEDCLYLNVWSSAEPGSALPVMVWIHGGALVGGAGSYYDGANLARRGAVVVTINYRLGALGYLAHPLLIEESPRAAAGNYGVLDQLAALRWVQRNIAAFGGDPSRVTIFGESAGSWSVQVLVASPLGAGLFHRAIGESGGVLGSYGGTPALREMADAGARYMDALLPRTPATLEAMRALPPSDLLRRMDPENRPWIRPAVDGWVLPASAREIFLAGRQNRVPTMVGWNANEGSLAVGAIPADPVIYKVRVRELYGVLADPFLALYPAHEEKLRSSFLTAYTEQNFGWEMRTWARLTARVGTSSFLYHFSRVPPGSETGAYHGAEVRYVFENLAAPGSRHPYDKQDQQLASIMATTWVQFAKSGNPNGEQTPIWSPFDERDEVLINYGDQVTLRRNFRKEALTLWDRFYGLTPAEEE